MWKRIRNRSLSIVRFTPGLRPIFCTWLISGGPVNDQSQTQSKENRLEALLLIVFRFLESLDRTLLDSNICTHFNQVNNEGIVYTKYSQEHNM